MVSPQRTLYQSHLSLLSEPRSLKFVTISDESIVELPPVQEGHRSDAVGISEITILDYSFSYASYRISKGFIPELSSAAHTPQLHAVSPGSGALYYKRCIHAFCYNNICNYMFCTISKRSCVRIGSSIRMLLTACMVANAI